MQSGTNQDSAFSTRIHSRGQSKEVAFSEDLDCCIGIIEMLFKCNIVAIVGGGVNPKYPLHKVMLWDDHQSKMIGELSFKSQVLGVKLRKDKYQNY